MWQIRDRGFLPQNNPIPPLEFEPEFEEIEYLASIVPILLNEKKFRTESVDHLEKVGTEFLDLTLTEEVAEKLFKHYSYFASSYVHAPGESSVHVPENMPLTVPKDIAKPLVFLAKKLDRHPILSYPAYCLNNWSLKDPTSPIELSNLELQQNFSLSNKKDEDWFILVHVEIEARAAKAISAMKKFIDGSENIETILVDLNDSLADMNATLNRMTEQCSEDFYFKAVRPFIFGFENVVYEGCYDNVPQSFRGETGAQSSIIPSFVAALGISHKNSMLTKHLDLMREYMPKPHRGFIGALEHLRDGEKSLRAYSKAYPELYNSVLNGLLDFRTKHLEYAINYIQKRVDNPTGTGGTPFVPWLSQLREETKEYIV